MAEPSAVTLCNPCRAKGMDQINYLIPPERKAKLKQYCKLKGVTMTSLISSLVAKELEEHYDHELLKAGHNSATSVNLADHD